MAAASAPDARCPRCSAALRPGAPWCTLCYADLRPPPEPVQQLEPVHPPGPLQAAEPVPVPTYDPLTDPLPGARTGAVDLLAPAPVAPSVTWPCTTCAAVNPLDADRCAACGSGFLAALRETEDPLLVLPGVGDITRLDRSQRLLLSAGFVLVILVLTVLLGALLG